MRRGTYDLIRLRDYGGQGGRTKEVKKETDGSGMNALGHAVVHGGPIEF